MEDLDKVVYWLYQGSGYLCDACKILNEEIHRTVIAVTNSKIKKAEAEEKKFEGGAGHQIVMDSQVKDAIKELWRNPGFYEVDKFFRDWAKDTIKGPRSGEIFSTLTQGAFGINELLARKDVICTGMLNVCTDIAEVCDNDEFEEALPLTYAYHLPTAFPKTHGLDLDYTKHASHVETEL